MKEEFCHIDSCGECCCTCALQLKVVPACYHLGGPGECSVPLFPKGPLGELARTTYKLDRDEKYAQQYGYACTGFASDDGIVMINMTKHGLCEAFVKRERPRIPPSNNDDSTEFPF